MDAMALITLDAVELSTLSQRISVSVNAGEQALICTSSDSQTSELLQVICGEQLPQHGRVVLFDTDTATIGRTQLLTLRRSCGFVTPAGDLIANLKLWENITLPLLYTYGTITHAQTGEIESLLTDFDYRGNLMALPAHLNLFERRMAAFVRAAVSPVQLIVYAGCLDGLSTEQRLRFIDRIRTLHRAKPDLGALWIGTTLSTSEIGMATTTTINLHQNPGAHRGRHA